MKYVYKLKKIKKCRYRLKRYYICKSPQKLYTYTKNYILHLKIAKLISIFHINEKLIKIEESWQQTINQRRPSCTSHVLYLFFGVDTIENLPIGGIHLYI